MSLPVFRTLDATVSVTLSRGRVFPVEQQVESNQLTQESELGQQTVVENGPDYTCVSASFTHLPSAEKDALLAFFAHPLVRWGKSVCTFVDEAGVSTQVRYWGPWPLETVEVAPAYWDCAFLLRREA
jgi:hypothetical protein